MLLYDDYVDCVQSSITWLAALTNAALVYLFRPSGAMTSSHMPGTSIDTNHPHTMFPSISPSSDSYLPSLPTSPPMSYTSLLAPAALLALASSHGYLLLRAVVRHVLERVLWVGSAEKKRVEEAERSVKEAYLRSNLGFGGKGVGVVKEVVDVNELGEKMKVGDVGEVKEGGEVVGAAACEGTGTDSRMGFWTRDEGMDEIRKGLKDS